MVRLIQKESAALAGVLDRPVTAVSMHRPSRETLDADLQIPGMVNSYGSLFFREFKYLSDSRRRWREPVREIVASERYDRIHLLTHAFWYHGEDLDIAETVRRFIVSAVPERYEQMRENITDLESILRKETLPC